MKAWFAVRLLDDDDDWPGRVGRATELEHEPDKFWVAFPDGEGGTFNEDRFGRIDMTETEEPKEDNL